VKKSTKIIIVGVSILVVSSILYFSTRGKEKSSYEKSKKS
jgi:hypothetical protein